MNQFIHNMSDAEYFALDAVNNSTLNLYEKSAMHGRVAAQTTFEPSASMVLGSAFHAYALEGEIAFYDRYIVAPPLDKRTKAGKAAWAELVETGKIIITSEQYTAISHMRRSLNLHILAKNWLIDAKTEVVGRWTDGLDFKCKFDALTSDGTIIDLKTTDDASKAGFTKSVHKYKYHRQAAFYSEGYKQITGNHALSFNFIVVETKPPYAVAAYKLDSHTMYIGEHEFRCLAKLYAECQDKKQWPGYAEDVSIIELPGWYEPFTYR